MRQGMWRWIAIGILVTSTSATAQDSVLVARARTLAWGAHYSQAIATYDTVLAHDSLAWEAALGRAQTMAWSGRLAEAEAEYRALSAAGAGPDADKGVAHVAAWRGDLARSERLWRALVARDSTDTESWTGLAEVLRWEGRVTDARDALGRGLAAHPDDADARLQQRWVQADLSAVARPTIIFASDNEHNQSTTVLIGADAPALPRARAFVTTSYRNATYTPFHATANSLGARVGASWGAEANRLTGRVDLGLAALHAARGGGLADTSTTKLTASAHAAVRVMPAVTVGVGASRMPFDETEAMIARGLMATTYGSDLSADLRHGVTAAAAAGYVRITGGVASNSRTEGSASIRWKVWHGLSVGTGVQGYGYSNAIYNGYFTPQRFLVAEGVVRYATEHELGWNWSAEAGVGAQQIDLDSTTTRPAERVSASLLYRPVPGFEYGLTAGYATAAPTQTVNATNYRAYSISLVGRVKL